MRNVGACGDVSLAHRLLGAHILRCANADAAFRQPQITPAAFERDAEIGDQRAMLMEKDVLRFHVAVDEATTMGVVQGTGDIAGDSHSISDRELSLAVQSIPQRLALDIRHDVVSGAACLARVVQRDDVRVLQRGGSSDLPEKTLGAHPL